jgi:hypothetical protein
MLRVAAFLVPAALALNSRGLSSSNWARARCGPEDTLTQWTPLVTPDATPAYPRPQLTRGASSWASLNGLWEWTRLDAPLDTPVFGKALGGAILVPYPPESCLSGVGAFNDWPSSTPNFTYTLYRLVFDRPAALSGATMLLQFGSVDWTAIVWLNQATVCSHVGGYSGFTCDVTAALNATDNELFVYAFDPTDSGGQPEGKQKASATLKPGGDKYTPTSGIWQTVWLESVPATYVRKVDVSTSLSAATLTVFAAGGGSDAASFSATVTLAGAPVATAAGVVGVPLAIPVPSASLWTPATPTLYDVAITLDGGDAVGSYFGMRTISLGRDATLNVSRPLLNGEEVFMSGWLDQSWWPDGLYAAPNDDALAFDVAAVKSFGLNFVRLHQKENPARWYYHADRLGVLVQQDMIQKFGETTADTVTLFKADLEAMIDDLRSHPSVVMWTVFNEGDCVKDPLFDPRAMVEFVRELDSTRLVDTNSGGPANALFIGESNDLHSYPYPVKPFINHAYQLNEIGEFGGIGAFIDGKSWVTNSCHTYLKAATPDEEAAIYINMTQTLLARKKTDGVSIAVYTQITDVELECDGFLNYDRTSKMDAATTAAIVAANTALITG